MNLRIITAACALFLLGAFEMAQALPQTAGISCPKCTECADLVCHQFGICGCGRGEVIIIPDGFCGPRELFALPQIGLWGPLAVDTNVWRIKKEDQHCICFVSRLSGGPGVEILSRHFDRPWTATGNHWTDYMPTDKEVHAYAGHPWTGPTLFVYATNGWQTTRGVGNLTVLTDEKGQWRLKSHYSGYTFLGSESPDRYEEILSWDGSSRPTHVRNQQDGQVVSDTYARYADEDGVKIRERQTKIETDSSGVARETTQLAVYYGATPPEEAGGSAAAGQLHYILKPSELAKYLKDYPEKAVNLNDPAAESGLDDTSLTNLIEYASQVNVKYVSTTMQDTLDLDMDYNFAESTTVARVELVKTASGGGCGCSGGSVQGFRSVAYYENANYTNDLAAYSGSAEAAKRNVWQTRTTSSLVDDSGNPTGLRTVQFIGQWGQPIYSVEQQMDGSNVEHVAITHSIYDEDGRVTEQRHPSSTEGYSTSTSNGWVTTVTADNSSTEGMVELFGYDSLSRQSAWRKVRQGASTNQSAYWVSKTTYTQHVASGFTTYLVQDEVSYPSQGTDENASDRQVTSHSYEFYSGLNAVEFHTTTHPTVSTTNNGTGSAATRVEHFARDTAQNLYHVDWTKNEDGTLDYTEVSTNQVSHGQTTKTIRDVDTTQTGDFSDLPSGWSTPSQGGTHQITHHTYYGDSASDVGSFGGIKETVGPDNHTNRMATLAIVKTYGTNGVAFTVGFVTLGAADNDPVSIAVSDPDGKNLVSAQGTATTGALTNYIDAEYLDNTLDVRNLQNGLVSGATLVSRSDTLYNDNNQVSQTRRYNRIPASGEGTATEDYLLTKYCYDAVTGWRTHQVEVLQGTGCSNSVEQVTKTVYDQKGRAIQTWVGLSDAAHDLGCSCQNDPSLSLLSETFYDQSAPGSGESELTDGNVTETRRYFGTNSTDYTAMVMNYDWRDRQTSTLSPGGVAQVSVLDNMGRAVTNQTYADASVDSNGVIEVFSADLRAQSASHFDERGQTWKTEQFAVDQTNGTVGSSVANLSWFDAAGRQIKSLGPDGLIRKTQYNGLGGAKYQFLSTEEGADTDPATVTDDTLVLVTETVYDMTNGARQVAMRQGTALANLVTVSKTWYDSNADGTGTEEYRVTGQSSLGASDSATNFLTTTFLYDDAGRQYATISPDPDGAGVLVSLKSVQSFDTLGRTLTNQTFAVGSPDTLLSQSVSVYTGPRLTETRQYKVVSGSASDYLPTKHYFDTLGRQCKVEQASGQFQKSVFDLAGQTLAQYLCTDEGSDTNAETVVDDTVIEQTAYSFDSARRPIATARYQRNDGATGAGELSTANARVSYSAVWYDDMSRQQTVADYGATNSFSRPETPPLPDSSDDVMVTAYTFDGFGRQSTITDNKGIVRKMLYDDAGRLTHTIENYDDFAVVSGQDTGTGDATDTSRDRVIKSVYDTWSRVVEQILLDQNGDGNTNDNQVTSNTYGVDTNCAVAREVLLKVTYPDSADAADCVTYSYYANGARKAQTDQRGVVHTYEFDNAGRLTADIASDLGTNDVDSAVRRVDYGYDDLGRQTFVRSRSGTSSSSDITNEVAYTYSESAWGQLVKIAQAHDGAVATNTPAMQYTWEDGAVSGIAKYVRQATRIYPNGRAVTNQYNSGIDDTLSRISGVSDLGSGTNALIQYTYLGAGTIAELGHPQVAGDLKVSYGTNGVYAGWDNFGRILDQKWMVGTNTVDRFQYTHDRLGNRVSRTQPWTSAFAVEEDYGYDGLQQLTNMVRACSAGSQSYGSTWVENFESYATNSQMHGQGGWKGWDNYSGAGALTSSAQTHGGTNSVAIVGASDLVHTYSGCTNGLWIYTTWQYIPTNFVNQQYLVMLNTYSDGGPYNWSVQVSFNGGNNKVHSDFDNAELDLVKGQWKEIRIVIDLDANSQSFYYGGARLYQKSWTEGVSGGGSRNIAAVDLYANSAAVIYYDDFSLFSPSTDGLDYAKTQSWALEPAGNWARFRDATNTETRTHNLFNEITAIDSNSLAVLHDAAGNMTRFPSVGRDGSPSRPLLATWDAWNRLTRLADTSDVTIATYTYDGDWKRLKKTVGTDTTEYYYDDMQLAETRTNGVASEQFVYDTRYLHSVALRDWDTDGDGDCVDSGGSERLFYCNDGNFNVTALVATNGAVVERYTYDPYGKVTIRDASWQPITWDASQKNVCLYTGHKFDAESGLYYSIYRYYHPGLGRWLTRDPISYILETVVKRSAFGRKRFALLSHGNTTDLLRSPPYETVRNTPVNRLDHYGLICTLPPSLEQYLTVALRNAENDANKRCFEMFRATLRSERICERVVAGYAQKPSCQIRPHCACCKDMPWTICGADSSVGCCGDAGHDESTQYWGVYVCSDTAPNVQRTIYHEITHYFQKCGNQPCDCSRRTGREGDTCECARRMCNEMRSRWISRQCTDFASCWSAIVSFGYMNREFVCMQIPSGERSREVRDALQSGGTCPCGLTEDAIGQPRLPEERRDR